MSDYLDRIIALQQLFTQSSQIKVDDYPSVSISIVSKKENKMLDDLSEENQLKLVSKCGILLKYISKQSADVQAAAVKNDSAASKYLIVEEPEEQLPNKQFYVIIKNISDLIISSLEIEDDDGEAEDNIMTILIENYFIRREP